MSTIRAILSRQEYLGHTVLRKSVSTNFKLHKRKNTDEDEQYVFYNTHEPIISQELWDSVQKRKKRANRTAARGTHSNRLSGYLYLSLIHILEWVRRMNNIRNQAEEIVLNEIVYQ